MDNTNIDKRKKTLGFIVGLLIMIFAALGVLGLVLLGVSAVKQAGNEKKLRQYAEYNEFLIPAAAIDIQPFDDIIHASMSELVEMSVWSKLNSDLDPDAYEYADGKMLLPAQEVAAEFTEFFGSEIAIEHSTVEGYGYEFTYDAAKDVYYIPLTTITPIYTPVVSGVEKKGGSVTVTCGLANASLWSQDKLTGEMKAPEPDKYIKVTLRSTGGEMFISAIQSSSTPETAATDLSDVTETDESESAQSENQTDEAEKTDTEETEKTAGD